jgi:hypothetical protein
MTSEPHYADRRIEWAILVLGLAGIPAIWLSFAEGTSPFEAWGFWGGDTYASWELGIIAAWLAGLLSFFLAPLVSLAQHSRCLGRPCSVWERRVYTAAAIVAIAGCLAILINHVTGYVIEGGNTPESKVAVFVALGIVAGMLVLWRLVSKQHKEIPAECLLMGAYIGGVATGAALYSPWLDRTAIVAGFTCVVYAVSLWWRIRHADAAG